MFTHPKPAQLLQKAKYCLGSFTESYLKTEEGRKLLIQEACMSVSNNIQEHMLHNKQKTKPP